MTTTIEPSVEPTILGGPPFAVGRAEFPAEPMPSFPHAGVQIADPAPLGLAAFAGTTFVLSLFNAGLVGEPALAAIILPLALIYGGLAQLLAGMWEFRKNNTFGAVAFTSYGAFWISFFYFDRFVAGTLPPAEAHTAVGIFLLMWTIFTAIMFVASLKTNTALVATFGVVLVTLIVLTLGEFIESTPMIRAAGFLGLGAAACAWYAAAAGVINATWGRTVLPLSMPSKG